MRIKILVVAAAIIFLNCATCFAEDLKFIDSEGDSGYFIDLDSVKVESASTFSVNMMIIKLNVNQMEIVDLQINHAAKNYVIRSTRTVSYDERTELSADNNQRPARGYSDKSLMGDIVKIIIYGGD